MSGRDDDWAASGTPWGEPPPVRSGRGAARWRWPVFGLVVALVTVVVGGWFYDYRARAAAVERAHSAFQRADCATVIDAAAEADRGTVPWGISAEPPPGGADEIDQCRELDALSADWDAGRYADTAQEYSTFASVHRGSFALVPLAALVHRAATSATLLGQVPGSGACSAMESLSGTADALEETFRASADLRRLVTAPVTAPTYAPADLVACAQVFEKEKQTEKASAFYTTALSRKPAKALAARATRGKARADVQLAKDAHARPLPSPTKVSGTGSGPAVIVVHNASPDQLEVTLSGAEPVLTTIKGCPGCKRYSGIGPVFCPDKGVDKSFRVPAGRYTVAVRSVSDGGRRVTPFVGSWKLEPGGRYQSCFSIAQSFG